jgi:hypothetical protein
MADKDHSKILHYRWEFLRRNQEFRRDVDQFVSKFASWFRDRGWWYDPEVKYCESDKKYWSTAIHPNLWRILSKWDVAGLVPYDWQFNPSGKYELRQGVSVDLPGRKMETRSGDVRRLHESEFSWFAERLQAYRSGEVVNGESLPESYLDRTIILSVDIAYSVGSNLAKIEAEIRNARREYKAKHGSLGRQERRPRRRFEQYDDYLKVWDLKQSGLSLAKIALEFYPDIDALERVRDHHRRAKELIGGQYREIE